MCVCECVYCLSLKRCESRSKCWISISWNFMLIFEEEWNTENKYKKNGDEILPIEFSKKKKLFFLCLVFGKIVCILRIWFILLVIVVERGETECGCFKNIKGGEKPIYAGACNVR